MVVGLVELGDALYGRFGIFRDLSHVADKLLEDLNQKIECFFTDGFSLDVSLSIFCVALSIASLWRSS